MGLINCFVVLSFKLIVDPTKSVAKLQFLSGIWLRMCHNCHNGPTRNILCGLGRGEFVIRIEILLYQVEKCQGLEMSNLGGQNPSQSTI